MTRRARAAAAARPRARRARGKGRPAVSLIIRTRNEERWITACLEAVFSQDFRDFEVVLVDNASSDKTVEKARRFPGVTVLGIDHFLPGRAINLGIRAAAGKYLVCLSGHCIPVDPSWLGHLVRNIRLPGVAGVYGRQQPLSYSSDLDKRDLLITFGLDRRVQRKDSFFHNANSIIRRSVWEEVPFDEEVTNIEDRVWAREVIRRGLKIVYEPAASVYHHHGIHQGADSERCQKIVRILERLEPAPAARGPARLCAVAVVPVRGPVRRLGGRPLLEYTLRRARAARAIDQVVVISEDAATLRLAARLGADRCLRKPPELTREYIDIQEILGYCLAELERTGLIADVLVYLSANCPFRSRPLLDTIVSQLVEGGYDTVLPTVKEYKSCWVEEGGAMRRVDEGFMPSQVKRPLHIGVAGLGTATYSDVIRHGDRLGKKIGMLELDDICQTIDVGKQGGGELAEMIVGPWWKANR